MPVAVYCVYLCRRSSGASYTLSFRNDAMATD